MDATRKIQVGIHGLSLDHNSMCPGNWVHIMNRLPFLYADFSMQHDTAGLFYTALYSSASSVRVSKAKAICRESVSVLLAVGKRKRRFRIPVSS